MTEKENCIWCGDNRHSSDDCPTRNLVRLLTGEDLPEDARLPDAVSVMDAEELFSKSETELHDEVKALKHIRGKTK